MLYWMLILVAFFDVYWILRLVLAKVTAYFRHPIGVGDEGIVYNICWTTDIDYFFHMNNGKYFREMDFGRFDFYFRCGFSEYIRSRDNMYFVQHGSSIKYRRPINFMVPFKQVTKLIYWDDRSLYFEQKLITLHDNFVRAISLCKNTCVGGTVVEMMASLGITTPPSCPEEVQLWIQSQEVSSNRLRIQGAGRSAVSLATMDSGSGGDDSGPTQTKPVITLNDPQSSVFDTPKSMKKIL